MALSRDAGRDLEARKGSFAGGGDAYKHYLYMQDDS